MAFELLRERGVPIEEQVLPLGELVPAALERPDPRTLIRLALARAVSTFSVAFMQSWMRRSRGVALSLARVQRSEQHERSLVSALWPAGQGALESMAAMARTALEVDAALALREEDPYVAQTLRFVMLEHVDELYRLDVLCRRLLGRGLDPDVLGDTEVLPGRSIWRAHRDPADDLRSPTDRRTALPMTRVAIALAESLCTLTRATFTAAVAALDDPLGRRLVVELGSIEDQHVTELASLHDPETPLVERWLELESAEVVAYHGCAHHEPASGLSDVWERLLRHELGQLQLAAAIYQGENGREPEGIIPLAITEPLTLSGHVEYVREVARVEADLTAYGTAYVDRSTELLAWPSVGYRQRLGSGGWPSQSVSEGGRPLDLAAE